MIFINTEIRKDSSNKTEGVLFEVKLDKVKERYQPVTSQEMVVGSSLPPLKRLISSLGGNPNMREYSRLNWEGLS